MEDLMEDQTINEVDAEVDGGEEVNVVLSELTTLVAASENTCVLYGVDGVRCKIEQGSSKHTLRMLCHLQHVWQVDVSVARQAGAAAACRALYTGGSDLSEALARFTSLSSTLYA